MQDTFHLWARHLLHHPALDEDTPWRPRGHWAFCGQDCPCCRADRFEIMSCDMCLDGCTLTQLNRHQRTLVQRYVRSLQPPTTSGPSWWAHSSSWRWRAYDWRGSDWWRSRWVGRRWNGTSSWYGASNWYPARDSYHDAEARYYDVRAVAAQEGQPATPPDSPLTSPDSPWATWPSAQ